MDKWLTEDIEDWGGQTSPSFKQFSKDFKSYLKAKLTKQDLELKDFSVGHYYISGFVFNPNTGRHAYFSISDVRHFPGEWHNNVLVRTAKDAKDYTGGTNGYTELENVAKRALYLTQ